MALGLAALLAFALLQARRRRAESALALAHGWAVSPPMALRWRVGVAGATAGVFILVISIPVPLLGPGTARAVSPASVTYYHGDHLGSSVVVTSDTSVFNPLRRVLYRPFGGVVAETPEGSSEPPEVGFTGQRFEEAAGIYNYGARWYDPNLGRFLQPDSIVPEPFNPQSLNRYSYVINDPVNHIDPTGNKFFFTGGSVTSGSIYETDYGYDVYVGSGTRYSASGGSSSSAQRQSSAYREDRPSAQQASGITAESFTFSLTLPVQPGRAASQRDVGVQVAGGNDATDAEALRRARQLEHGLIIDPRHPLARAGFGEGTVRSPETEILIQAYGEAYAETALVVAAGPLGRGVSAAGRVAVQAGKAVAQNPYYRLNTFEALGNFESGYRRGSGMRPPGTPFGGTPGAYGGYYSGYAIGLGRKLSGVLDGYL